MTEQEIIKLLKRKVKCMSDNSSNGSDSFAMFINMLQVLFIGLKLTNNIDWSWWWVLSPTWIQFVIVVFFICFLIIGRRNKND